MKKEKYLQIFNYLKEFSKLRSNPVRDIDAQETQYPEKIWLNDIPVDDIFENVVRTGFNPDNDFWIRIKKPKEPTKPSFAKLPPKLDKWVEPTSLLNEDEEPFLFETIQVDGKELNSDDFPGLVEELDGYVENKWIDDLIDYKDRLKEYEATLGYFEKLNNTYKQFFRIYNKSQQFGEEFELVIGVGLLNFQRKSNGERIFRHIITQVVDINFEYSQKDSQILISPNIESNLQIETDSILDLIDQFDSQDIIEAEKAAEDFIKLKEIDTIFNVGIVDDVLQLFAERVSSDGKYINTIVKPASTEIKPTVSFSPAILLRKRNTRSFTALYENILENIQNEGDEVDIPTMDDLIGVQNEEETESSGSDTFSLYSENDTIYFPKEFNDEQIEIIEKARKNKKVLVQGPPGTGKSHTIANLICHLLANGKKVLITAYTKRALEVLKDKLPEEFQDLAVNLLSSDSSSFQDLEKSVNSINEILSQANLVDYQIDITRFEEELNSINEEIANKTSELISIKEKATRDQSINTNYFGTLTHIAELLESESAKYEWYKDSYSDIQNGQIFTDVKTYIDSSKNFEQVDLSEFEYIIPSLERIPSIDQIEEGRALFNLLSDQAENTHIKIGCSNFNGLLEDLKALCEFYIQSDILQLDLTNDIIGSYFNGKAYLWSHKLEMATQILNKYDSEEIKRIDKDVEVTYASAKSLKQYKKDALTLRDYLKDGNSLTGISLILRRPFLSKEIKERLPFMSEVKVNGSSCDSIAEFETVLIDIELRQDLEELSEIWDREIPIGNSYNNKFVFFKNINSEVIKLLDIINKSEELRKKIESNSNLKITSFDQEAVLRLIDETKYNQLLQKSEKANVIITTAVNYLDQTEFHPIKSELIDAMKRLDPNDYSKAFIRLEPLDQNRKQYLSHLSLKSELEQRLPNLLNSIALGEFTETDLSKLKDCIFYRHAQDVIGNLLEVDNDKHLIQGLSELEKKKKKTIALLASKKAWYTVIDGLQDNRSLRQHLDAWVMAVRKIGKTGKGKRSIKFKRISQQEMEYCKDSIPCWIMPLYKVAETIRPEKGMYDYVIIDEASQLGPDAIFLLYISKNIIIVGDDKQTSPEYVGVDANSMMPHINRYLKGIPFKDYYGTEFSFFDHARFFCTGVTVLREHFRCMPEIIEFSNKNFYAPEGKGLYPLKQYSENRLTPLETVFCPNGYINGTGSAIINEPEANKIVDTIAGLIQDKRYKNKTFGVISLQGNRQSSIIENNLIKRIGEKEYHNRKIICGNSASFQGDERDIIFLSLVTAQNHNRSALVKPEDARRFNVAVSRAKEQIWLFHSVQIEDLSNKDDLRYKLLDHFKHYNTKQLVLSSPIERGMGTQPEPFDSWFEVDVYNDIVSNGLSVIPQYRVAQGRYIIDLVALFGDGTKIAIECDGDKWHGAEQYQKDLMRQKVLERCGWQFFRVKGFEYYTNRIKALDGLWKMIPSKASVTFPHTQIEKPEEYPQIELDIPDKSALGNLSNTISHSSLEDASFFDPSQKASLYPIDNQTGNEIIRYFNLYNNGTYIMTDTKSFDADYVLPIYSNHRNGFLLQCYNSGHINKVFISYLLSRKIDKEYMNGYNKEDELCSLKIIEADKIIGIYFNEGGKSMFKAHLTENISSRELLHLQGFKVMYRDFKNIEYKILPLEIAEGIKRLIFQSFSASGKPINNSYYDKEWSIIKKFSNPEPQLNKVPEAQRPSRTLFDDEVIVDDPPKVHIKYRDEFPEVDFENPKREEHSLFKNIGLFSTVRIKFINTNKEVTLQLVKYKFESHEYSNGIQRVNIDSTLGISLIGKTVGDVVKIINSENLIEVMEVIEG